MDDFIKSAVEQLGIDESVICNATGSVLGFLKQGSGVVRRGVFNSLNCAPTILTKTCNP